MKNSTVGGVIAKVCRRNRNVLEIIEGLEK